jgi:hypothetical protein
LCALGALADCVAEGSVASCADAPKAAPRTATATSSVAPNAVERECELRLDDVCFTVISFVFGTGLGPGHRDRSEITVARSERGAQCDSRRRSTSKRDGALRDIDACKHLPANDSYLAVPLSWSQVEALSTGNFAPPAFAGFALFR